MIDQRLHGVMIATSIYMLSWCMQLDCVLASYAKSLLQILLA